MISNTRLMQLLQAQAMSADVAEAAVADNCRFDERISPSRWQTLYELLPKDSQLYPGDLAEAGYTYKQRWLDVPSNSIPDSFLPTNAPALLEDLAPEQKLVRLELLTWPLDTQDLSMETLQSWSAEPDKHAAALDQFLLNWNQQRDNRPAFAAFYDEVQTECESDDWPHLLRDRLGLGFYPDSARCPVALMRYSLQEVMLSVKRDGRSITVCALPTTLDGGLHEYFYPVPAGRPYGATLHLAEGMADLLAAEILHFRIQYQRKHLWKLGWIDRPHRFSDPLTREAPLREARDLHLLQLRIDSERDDFGAEMGGRR